VKKHIFTALLLILTFNSLHAQTSVEHFKRLSTEEGLSQSIVTCIFQDSRGFLWFGTQNGLNKYDAYSFTIYRNDSSQRHTLSGNFIRCIYEDTERNMWIGTEDRGLNLYDRFQDRFVPVALKTNNGEKLDNLSIYSIIDNKMNELWLATSEGLIKFHKTNRTTEKILLNSEENLAFVVNTLLSDKKNRIWVGTENGLFLFDQNEKLLHQFQYEATNSNSLNSNNIHCIYEDLAGNIIVGTERGLCFIKPDNLLLYRNKSTEADFTQLSGNEIYSITQDRKNNYWFATFGHGLWKYDKRKNALICHTYNPNDNSSVSDNYILSLLIDRSGLLWIGTYNGGINKLNQEKI